MDPNKYTRAPASLFWYWINERHRIYLARAHGQPWPWTEDPILRTWKFTNVFRRLDRMTEYLVGRLQLHADAPLDIKLFNCVAFRYSGGEAFWNALGWLEKWDQKEKDFWIKTGLDLVARGERVFTHAYLIHSFHQPGPKHIVIANEALDLIWQHRHELVQTIQETKSIEAFCKHLRTFRGFKAGGFLAYEVACDLTYIDPLNNAVDLLTWANPGKGAIRGLIRLLDEKPSEVEAIAAMRYLLEQSEHHIEHYVPPLQIRDIEHSLCEFDKYCRAKFAEGRPKQRYTPAERRGKKGLLL